jgi:16S rRNA (guanine527-N7)-methyltransferase
VRELVRKYFKDLNEEQLAMFEKLPQLYEYWNSRINVVSRKDMAELPVRHVLHSLGIARVISFAKGTKVLDVGTGGGFPGIPLAIMFPSVEFTLVDSIGKKIKVVSAVAEELGLTNVTAVQTRAEEIKQKFDFVVSRAVTEFPLLYNWVRKNISADSFNELPNGMLALKGGDLETEMGKLYKRAKIFGLSDFFTEEFFETKKVVYLPA